MNIKLLMVLTGVALHIVGGALLLPLGMAFLESQHQILAFFVPSILAFFIGRVLIRFGRGYKERLLVREGAVLMLLIWGSIIIIGLMPYVIAGRLGVFDAFCESVSGFTTTGITMLGDTETRAVVFWRSLTQWLGGLNIIMLLVTLMPQINSGISLKIVLPPNMSFGHILHTMKRMSNGVAAVYLTFTAAAFCAYLGCGLGCFDALNMAMVTLATGGCYKSAAVTDFTNPAIDIVTMILMMLSGGNFLLYWQAARHRTLDDIIQNSELRAYYAICIVFGIFISLHLWGNGVYDFLSSFRYGFFEVASFLSTTGVYTSRFPLWPELDQHLLFLLVFIGGCVGSSAGGFKVLRFMILGKSAIKELQRMLHPHMVINISIGKFPVPQEVVGWILTFFFLYMIVFFGFSALISLEGINEFQSMGIVAACFSNVGTAFLWAGSVSSFGMLSVGTKFLCCVLMLLGRVEIFSVLVVMELLFGRNNNRW